MKNNFYSEIESNYRALFGKLFSTLIRQFGTSYVNEIEDAIQNAFLKSLKTWSLSQSPDKKENWLFIVARNDVLNQIASSKRKHPASEIDDNQEYENTQTDLRLETILFISSARSISKQAKVLFILKNLFGLSVSEISESTLINSEAVYKAVNRAKTTLKTEFSEKSSLGFTDVKNTSQIKTVEEILYAVFNIGFDSFDPKVQSIINEDLCLEAMALAKLLYKSHQMVSTKNLLALFCFHSARIPAKVTGNKLVSFFNQDQTKWNRSLINAGFNYLTKPKYLNRFYIEALIVSKYITSAGFGQQAWNEIIDLYKLLLKYNPSAVVKLNQCYALHKAGRTNKAFDLLNIIEKDFPERHLYFSLMKAELLKDRNAKESKELLDAMLTTLDQSIRKDFLMEIKPIV